MSRGPFGSVAESPVPFLEAFFAASGEPAAFLDASGIVLRANAAMGAFTGIPPADLPGSPFEKHLPGVMAGARVALAAGHPLTGAPVRLDDGRTVALTLIPAGDGGACVVLRPATIDDEQLAALFELPQLVVMLDPDARVVFRNRAAREYFGEHRVGRDGSLHPDDRPAMAAAVAEARRTSGPIAIDIRLRRPRAPRGDSRPPRPAPRRPRGPPPPDTPLRRHDGEFRWHTWRSHTIVTAAGPRRLATALDIHDRKTAEEASLRANRAGLEALHALPTRIIFLEDGGLMFANRAARQLAGTEIEPRADGFVPEVVHPDDAAIFRATRRAAGDEPYALELRLRDRAGAYRWHLWHAGPMSPTRRIGLAIDIRDRVLAQEALERAEERSRVLGETLPLVVWAADADGRCTYTNRHWREFTGLEGEAALDWSAAMHPDDVEPCLAAFAESLAKGEPFEFEYRIRHHDGEYCWHLGRATPWRDASGAILGWFGGASDIHSQREAARVAGRLAALVESTSDAVIGMTLDGRIESWNAAAERTYGYTPAEVLGRPFTEVVRTEGDTAAGFAAVAAGAAIHLQTVDYRKDGTPVRVEVNLSPVLSNGEVTGCSAIVRDVTDLRRQQEAEARLAAIVDSAADAIISIDTDGRFTSWNSAAERVYGWTAEEALGQDFLELTVPPEHRAAARAGWALAAAGVAPPPFESRRLRKGGDAFEALVALSPIVDRSGTVIGASAIVRDVTEFRRHESAQALLAAIVQSAHDAIIVRSLDGEVLSWNAAAERLYGWTAEEAVGRPITAFVPPGAPDLSPEVLSRIVAGDEPSSFESRRLHRSGRPIDVSVTLSPVRDPGGAVTAVASIAREIGEQRRQREQIAALNRELEMRLSELEKAMAVKDEFLGSVSHELRTPLTSLVGLIHMLHERGELVDRESRREAFDQLATDATRLQQIIENMLILARLDHTTFEAEPLLVQRVAPAVLAAHRRRFPSHNLIEDFPADLPVVLAQRTWVDQVLTNLLSNAQKYTPPDAPVEVLAVEREADVEISVLDRGPGLTEDEARRIFEPFTRLQRDRYRGPGSGLGLAVCRRLVELMGGTIDARPRPGGGAIFQFRLPRAGEE
ncbi:MAG TPA: PAS domain S-box protein [Tepidiformaceae bacterium]|nr:PAS domain S-box protein [Tepidiformaceae bacterium]